MAQVQEDPQASATPLVILGAGGYARQVADTAIRSGDYYVAGFLDETIDEPSAYLDIPILPELAGFHDFVDDFRIVAAVGSIDLRKRWTRTYSDTYQFASIVDPSSIVSPTASVGSNVVILGFTVVSSEAVVGFGANINWQCLVSHGVTVGAFCDVASGVKLTGNCHVGEACQIGTNAVVLPRVRVGDAVVLGAGAVANRDIESGCTAVGVPARVIRTGAWPNGA